LPEPGERADTLTLRTYHGTEIKVSIPLASEQTSKVWERDEGKASWTRPAALDVMATQTACAGGQSAELLSGRPPDRLSECALQNRMPRRFIASCRRQWLT
jgi:hypothetical protein